MGNEIKIIEDAFANIENINPDSNLDIINAIKGMNLLKKSRAPDVIILARGGGTVEDLWCFNEEKVVRSIFLSHI